MKTLVKVFAALLLLSVVIVGCKDDKVDAPAVFKISTQECNFEPTNVGDSKSFKITITNIGEQALELEDVYIEGNGKTDFAYKGKTKIVVKAKEKYPCEIIFTPKTEGVKKATLVVKTNIGTYKVTLKGKANPKPTPVFSISPESYNFSAVEIGKTKTQKFVVSNKGNADLVISKAEITGANADQFAVAEKAATIAPNKTKEYTVTYTPTNMDNTTVMAYLTLHTQTSVEKVQLTATPLPKPAPVFSVEPKNYDFGSVEIGKKATKKFVITNTGTADLVISSYKIESNTNEQITVTDCKGTVAPNKTKEFIATFTPKEIATVATTLKLQTNAGEQSIGISGMPAPKPAPIFEVDPKSHTFNATYVGEKDSRSIALKNTGNAKLTINSITLVGENKDQFELTDHTAIKEIDAGGYTDIRSNRRKLGSSRG